MENMSKTALSIHAVSKVMRAIKANLLQNGGDKQILSNLNLLEDDGTAVALLNVHRRDDLKAASDPKAAANLSKLLFVVDMFLEAENTAQEQKFHDLLITGGDVPKPSGLPALPPRGVSWLVVRHEAFIPGSHLASAACV